MIDFFEFETTRIRVHKQEPGQTIPIHTDDNNVNAKTNEDFRLRAVTALTESEDFIYQFYHEEKIEQFSLKKGETVLFDPDLVGHGMKNQSKTETRYSLVQIFKAYPVTPWLKDFINTEQDDSFMNIDFGTAFHKPNGNAVKVTINEFRDKLYLYILRNTQWMETQGSGILQSQDSQSLLMK